MNFSLKYIRRYIFLAFLVLPGHGFAYSQNETGKIVGEKRSLTSQIHML